MTTTISGDQACPPMIDHPGWLPLLQYLERRYADTRVVAERVRFTHSSKDATNHVGGFLLPSASGRPWLSLGMKVGTADRWRPWDALAANLTLPIGALTTWKGDTILRQTLPLDGLQYTDLDQCLDALAAVVELLSDDAQFAELHR